MTSPSVATEGKIEGGSPVLDGSLRISSDNVVRPSSDRKVATIRTGNQEISFTKKDGSAFTAGEAGELVALNAALANAKTNGMRSKLESIAAAKIKDLQISVISLDKKGFCSIEDSKLFGIPLADDLTIKNTFLAKGQKLVFDGKNLTCENVFFCSKNALVLRNKAETLHFKGCAFPEGVKDADSQRVRIYKRDHAFRLAGKAERLILENTIPADRSHMIDQSMLSLRKDGHRTQIEFKLTTNAAEGVLRPDAAISLYKGSMFKDKNAPELTEALMKRLEVRIGEELVKVQENIDSLTEAFKGINQEFEQARDKAIAAAIRLQEFGDKAWPLANAWRSYLKKRLDKATEKVKPLQELLNEKKKELVEAENTRQYLAARQEGCKTCKKCVDVKLVDEKLTFIEEGTESVKPLKDSLSLRPKEFGAKLASDYDFLTHISKYAEELSKELMNRLVKFLDKAKEKEDELYLGCPQLCGVYDLNQAKALFDYYMECKKAEIKKLEEGLKSYKRKDSKKAVGA